MKKRYLIPAVLIGLLAARVLWVSRPEPPENAELTDTCESKGISNAQYRALIPEAKALLAPYRKQIRTDSSELKKFRRPLPKLALLIRQFLTPSQSSTELLVRLAAVGRALDGRIGTERPLWERTRVVGVGVAYSMHSDDPLQHPPPYLVAGFDLQAPPGTMHYDFVSWFVIRLFGRRFDLLRIDIEFRYYKQYITPNADAEKAMVGAAIEKSLASSVVPLHLFSDPTPGDARWPYHCPDIATALRELDAINREIFKP